MNISRKAIGIILLLALSHFFVWSLAYSSVQRSFRLEALQHGAAKWVVNPNTNTEEFVWIERD